MTEEMEKTQRAMDLMGWLLRNRAFLYTVENQYAGESTAELLEIVQDLYNNGFYEACVFYLFLCRNQPCMDEALNNIVEELLRLRWKNRGTKRFLENLMEKIRDAEEACDVAMRKINAKQTVSSL